MQETSGLGAVAHRVSEERRGEAARPWRTFLSAYRANLLSGNVLYLPVAAAGVMLAADARWSGHLTGGTGSAVRWGLLVLAVALAGAAVHLGPAFVHYDVSPLTCLRKAGSLALHQAPTTVLLLVLLDGWVQILSAVPLLALLGGVGGWIRLSTELCLFAYRRNVPPATAPSTTAPSAPPPSTATPSVAVSALSGRMIQTKES